MADQKTVVYKYGILDADAHSMMVQLGSIYPTSDEE